MDILAWIVLALATSTIILPAVATLVSSDSLITYGEAWALGHVLAFCGLALFAIIGGIVWAFERVLW